MADGTEGAIEGEERDITLPLAGNGNNRRVLALCVRPQKFGYVVLEGPTRLLDWGVRSWARASGTLRSGVLKGINPLLKLYAPSAIVLRNRRGPTAKTDRNIQKISKIVREEAQSRSIDVSVVTELEVQEFFEAYRSQTKHEIASTLAAWFQELAWKLPPKRKPWMSEDHNMVIFDAAASGITHLSAKSDAQVADQQPF